MKSIIIIIICSREKNPDSGHTQKSKLSMDMRANEAGPHNRGCLWGWGRVLL